MRLFVLWIGLVFAMCSHAEGLQKDVVQTNMEPAHEIRYTWAVGNLNMREAPDVKSTVLTRLPYATAVEVLPQDEPPVPFEMVFFNQQNTAESLTQTSTEFPKVILHGQWLKVRADGYEGYVFSGLLMEMPPPLKDEGANSYLIRIFGLTLEKTDRRTEKSLDSGVTNQTNIFIREYYTSALNGVRFIVIDDTGDAEIHGNGGEIVIPDMDFEQAIVFFSVVHPPLQEGGAWYEEGKSLEYLLDMVGNSAKLEATKQGVSFSWIFGLN